MSAAATRSLFLSLLQFKHRAAGRSVRRGHARSFCHCRGSPTHQLPDLRQPRPSLGEREDRAENERSGCQGADRKRCEHGSDLPGRGVLPTPGHRRASLRRRVRAAMLLFVSTAAPIAATTARWSRDLVLHLAGVVASHAAPRAVDDVSGSSGLLYGSGSPSRGPGSSSSKQTCVVPSWTPSGWRRLLRRSEDPSRQPAPSARGAACARSRIRRRRPRPAAARHPGARRRMSLCGSTGPTPATHADAQAPTTVLNRPDRAATHTAPSCLFADRCGVDIEAQA